LLRRI